MTGLSEEKKPIKVSIARFNPYVDNAPHLETYEVNVIPGSTILTVLLEIRQTHDSSLAFRFCCKSSQCGSCAVRVNGTPVLSCEHIASEGDIIEPLNLPVILDLVTDLNKFLSQLGNSSQKSSCHHKITTDEIEKIKPLRTCIECISCISACPAINSFAGPTILAKEARFFFDPRSTNNHVLHAVNKGLFACTTCGKCLEVCPKHINIPEKAIEKLREAAVRAGYSLDAHKALAALIEQTGRSVKPESTTFLDSAQEVYEPDKGTKYRGTVGFFVGCMFNARVIQPARDTVSVLTRNGYRVIIPKSQVCCGSPLIRTGHTKYVPELQKKNIEAFSGIDTVITVCAGCGATLKKNYKTPFTVYDFTEFLVKEGFELPAKINGKYTYHDPCHLLRGQGIKTQPRTLIQACADTFIDLEGQCCGAGGGVRAGLPAEATEIGAKRAQMIQKTGADSVITCCPFCEFHIHNTTGLPVINIASLLAEGYRKKDETVLKN